LYYKANSLRKLNIWDQTRDVQNVCAVTKGGTILKLMLTFVVISAAATAFGVLPGRGRAATGLSRGK